MRTGSKELIRDINSHLILEIILQEGRILVTEDKYEDLLNTLKKQKCPDVRFEHHPDEIGYVHRRTEDGDLYFIANISPGEQEETIWFRGGEPRFSVFDPMDCREKAGSRWKKQTRHSR